MSKKENRQLSPEEVDVRNRAQIEEAQSDENRWYAGEDLGRPPTDREALMHYIKHGGAEEFARRWDSLRRE